MRCMASDINIEICHVTTSTLTSSTASFTTKLLECSLPPPTLKPMSLVSYQEFQHVSIKINYVVTLVQALPYKCYSGQ